MTSILIGLCAASLLLNIVLASYCQRLGHIANFWREELKRETSAVKPVNLKMRTPVEALDAQDWEKEWD